MENRKKISKQAMHRLPYYLQFLRKLRSEGAIYASAPVLAAKFKYTEIQVRKDISSISSVKGKPKTGFEINTLIADLEETLGYNKKDIAVLVGVGSLGKALLGYKGFEFYGIEIVAAFDSDPSKKGTIVSGKNVYSSDDISIWCRENNVPIGIITVPEQNAQIACDQLVAGNIKAIWNFAPTHLSVPQNIHVQNENMAASLALLSKHLKNEN